MAHERVGVVAACVSCAILSPPVSPLHFSSPGVVCASWEEKGSSGYCEYTIESVDFGDGRAGNKVYCVRDDLIDRLFVCLFFIPREKPEE